VDSRRDVVEISCIVWFILCHIVGLLPIPCR